MKFQSADPGRHRIPWLTGLGAVVAIWLHLAYGDAPGALVYDRTALVQGELWRWVTGHLVHCGGGHALWDITAFVVIGCILEAQGRTRMLLASLLGVVVVDGALWFGLPGLTAYCGLSGLLNTLMVVTLAGLWRVDRHPAVAMVALGLIIKLALETVYGGSLVGELAWPSVPAAHWAGCLGGVLFVLADGATRGRCPPRGRACLAGSAFSLQKNWKPDPTGADVGP